MTSRGYHHSEETKRRIGDANRIALTGRQLSSAHRQNISDGHKKSGAARRPHTRTESGVAALREGNLRWRETPGWDSWRFTEEYHENLRSGCLRRWESSEYRKHQAEAGGDRLHRTSKDEEALAAALSEITATARHCRVGGYIPDIILVNHKTIVEYNGCYWHSCDRCGYTNTRRPDIKSYDQRREAYLRRAGYRVFDRMDS